MMSVAYKMELGSERPLNSPKTCQCLIKCETRKCLLWSFLRLWVAQVLRKWEPTGDPGSQVTAA